MTPSCGNFYKEHGRMKFCFLPACPRFLWQIHLTRCWGIPLLVVKPTSGFQWRLKDQLRYPALWTDPLPDSRFFCQETIIVGLAEPWFVSHSNNRERERLIWDWKSGSAVKSTYPCRGSRFNSQYPQGLTTAHNSSARGSNPLFWLPWVPGTHVIHKHAFNQSTHSHKIK